MRPGHNGGTCRVDTQTGLSGELPSAMRSPLGTTSVKLSLNFVCGIFTVACLCHREPLVKLAAGGAECATKPCGPRPIWRCNLFKVHDRCAEYRQYIISTACGACGKEFWTLGRVEDHLRASTKCVRKLQRSQCPGTSLLPGYGSKKRRQQEAENFTPALPTLATESVEVHEVRPWNKWQQQLHCELCDVILDQPIDEGFFGALWRKVCKFPMYTEEIQQVISFLLEEVRLIAADDGLQQWTAQQFDQLTAALVKIPDREPESVGETQRESATLHSRAAFSKGVAELNWTEAVQQFQTDHETRASALFTLSDDWEAAWSQTRGAEVSAAVIEEPLSLLPKVLW